MKPIVTPELAKRYENEGYLILHSQVFSPDKFERVKKLCAAKFVEATKDGRTPALIDCPHWADPAMWEWIASKEMLDIIEPIVGPDIAIFACHLLRKPPSVGKRVPWHEDSAYWKGALTPMEVSSITLALEPSIPENGCLRVIPGTHRGGYSEYNPVTDDQVFGIEIKPAQMDESKAVDIGLQPNEASIHECRIMHGSNPNTGSLLRSVLTVRYFSTKVKFTPQNHPAFEKWNFPIYLARGRDHAGNKYADPTKPRGGAESAGTAV
jgi:hypothetical protein